MFSDVGLMISAEQVFARLERKFWAMVSARVIQL